MELIKRYLEIGAAEAARWRAETRKGVLVRSHSVARRPCGKGGVDRSSSKQNSMRYFVGIRSGDGGEVVELDQIPVV